MSGSMVTFQANGRTADGYLVLPPSGAGPGLLVIQEWWGLVDHIKSVAERFAKEGFVALAPDIYHGERTTRPDQAGELLMALDIAGPGGGGGLPAPARRGHAEEGRRTRLLHGRAARALRGAGASRRD